MPSSEFGLVLAVPIIGARTWKLWKFWEGLGCRLSKFWCPLVESVSRLDVVTCGWLGGLVVGAGPCGWALTAVVSLLIKGRTWKSLLYGFVWRTVSRIFHVWKQRWPWGMRDDEHKTLGFMCIFFAGVSNVFRGRCLFDLGYNVTDIYVRVCDQLGVMRMCPVAI